MLAIEEELLPKAFEIVNKHECSSTYNINGQKYAKSNSGYRCSVCLGDYQADDRLQRLPQCGHTFHVDCIDHWLANNTTCPLCRVSLIPFPSTKAATDSVNHEDQESEEDRAQRRSFAIHENAELETERNYHEFSAGDVPRELEDTRHYGGGSVVIDVQVHDVAEENLRT